MKCRVLFLTAFVICAGSIFAQGEMDAYKLSQTDLTGTARSVSMGGAFGALGGDISGIAINPAGIGVYRSSEIVTTMNFQNSKTEINSNLGKFDDSKFKFTFDNLAFVTVFPLYNESVPSINFGFSYNRVKNYDRKYSMNVMNGTTLADYMLERTKQLNFGGKHPDDELLFENKTDTYPLDHYDWLAVFGYNSGLIGIDSRNNQFGLIDGLPGNAPNSLYVHEKGSVNTYDFNAGTTISDIVSLGLTLSITDIKYRLYSELVEDYGHGDDIFMRNDLRTDGSGFQVSAGVIIKPINELRIGLAYHSPTWYNMTDNVAGRFEYNLAGFTGLEDGFINTDFYTYDYKLRTPDRWTASIAGIIGQTAIISADYEYTNYGSNMKLYDDHGDPLAITEAADPNTHIKNHFKGASTLRVGAEVRITPQFSARVGYQWRQSPMKKEFRDNTSKTNVQLEPMTVGTITHYTMDGDTNYITYGLGYRFTRNFYTDIAFVMRSQKSDIYTNYYSEKSEWKDNTFQGLLTLGYRF